MVVSMVRIRFMRSRSRPTRAAKRAERVSCLGAVNLASMVAHTFDGFADLGQRLAKHLLFFQFDAVNLAGVGDPREFAKRLRGAVFLALDLAGDNVNSLTFETGAQRRDTGERWCSV